MKNNIENIEKEEDTIKSFMWGYNQAKSEIISAFKEAGVEI